MTVDNRVATLDRAGWLTLLAVGFGVSLVIMDATIVNVALPVVLEDLHLTASDAQWLNASYSLMFAALLITAGRIGDQSGRRRMFAIGMVTFLTASVFAGASQNAWMLISARFAQGVGAAMIVPVDAVHPQRDLHRAGTHGRLRCLGVGHRRHGRRRPPGRRLAGHRRQLAMGVLAQHPDQPGRARGHRPGGPREP